MGKEVLSLNNKDNQTEQKWNALTKVEKTIIQSDGSRILIPNLHIGVIYWAKTLSYLESCQARTDNDPLPVFIHSFWGELGDRFYILGRLTCFDTQSLFLVLQSGITSRGLDGSFGILATKIKSFACKANNCPNHGTISLYLISFFFILGRRQKLLEQGEKWPAGCVWNLQTSQQFSTCLLSRDPCLKIWSYACLSL